MKMSLSDCEWECTSNTSGTSARGEEAFARKKAKEQQKGKLNSLLIEFIIEWRKIREKDEEELSKLKEKQLRRKEVRAEQKRAISMHKKEDEDTGQAEEGGDEQDGGRGERQEEAAGGSRGEAASHA